MSIEIVVSDWCEDEAVYEGRALIIKLFGLYLTIGIGRR